MKKLLLFLLLLPLIAFMNSGCDNESKAQQEAEEIDALAVDFVQNVISGSVGEKISENEHILELTLSPNTVFTADMPRRDAGSITTETFYDNFDVNFQGSFPNAILSINEGDGPSALPFEMKDPVFDPTTGVLEVIISPLETATDAGEAAVNLLDIEDITSPFGQSSLFIDDASNTCQGLVLGTCSSGLSSGVNNQCAIDGECIDIGATCNGGTAGTCSVTREDCFDMFCCSAPGGCLTQSPTFPGL